MSTNPTNPPHDQPVELAPEFEARLQAYLDGELSPDERSRLEHEARVNPALRVAIERSLAIEAQLRRRLVPEAVDIDAVIRAGGDQSATRAPRAGGGSSDGAGSPLSLDARSRGKRPLKAWMGLAAAVLIAVALGAYFMSRPARDGLQTPAQAYGRIVRAGFTPTVVCENDEQVIAFTRQYLGNPLRINVASAANASPPVALTLVGWGYEEHVVTPRTVSLLAKADGDQIVVFADQAHLDTGGPASFDGTLTHDGRPLRVFRAQVGTTVLYEVSPRETPVVLPAIERAR